MALNRERFSSRPIRIKVKSRIRNSISVMRIRKTAENQKISVADPGCLSRIPDQKNQKNCH
jgi:hypothetical protein